jgi:hypothetical protein
VIQGKILDLVQTAEKEGVPTSQRSIEWIQKSIIEYVLGLSSSSKLKVDVGPTGLLPYVRELKTTFLDRSSYTASQFWRAMYMLLIGNPIGVTSFKDPTVGEMSTKYNVSEGDMYTALDLLSPKQLAALRRTANAMIRKGERVEVPASLMPFYPEIETYCRKLVNKKMRFLANNDGGQDLDDYFQEILTDALVTFRHYDYYKHNLLLLNTMRRGAHNSAMNKIKYHVAGKRARIIQTKKGTEDSHAVFAVTTLSLDYEMGEEGAPFSTWIADEESPNAEKLIANEQAINQMVNKAPEPYNKVISLIFSKIRDIRFEFWLTDNYQVDFTECSNEDLVYYACKYHGVTLSSFKQIAGNLLPEQVKRLEAMGT